jgi:hypothetical protein
VSLRAWAVASWPGGNDVCLHESGNDAMTHQFGWSTADFAAALAAGRQDFIL